MAKIDRHIPLPPQNYPPRPVEYPWDDMQPGDSIFLTTAQNPTVPMRLKNNGWKFTTREWRQDGLVGVRVWRTA